MFKLLKVASEMMQMDLMWGTLFHIFPRQTVEIKTGLMQGIIKAVLIKTKSIDKPPTPFMTENQTKHQANMWFMSQIKTKKSDDRVAIFRSLVILQNLIHVVLSKLPFKFFTLNLDLKKKIFQAELSSEKMKIQVTSRCVA